jgi:signal transduction histidine kinase
MFEGTGLGLAIVKKYSDLNDAYVSVESLKGKGSTFRVVFPKGYQKIR